MPTLEAGDWSFFGESELLVSAIWFAVPIPRSPRKHVVGRLLGEQGDKIVAQTRHGHDQREADLRRCGHAAEHALGHRPHDRRSVRAFLRDRSCRRDRIHPRARQQARSSTPPTHFKSRYRIAKSSSPATIGTTTTTRAISDRCRKTVATSASSFVCGARAAGPTTSRRMMLCDSLRESSPRRGRLSKLLGFGELDVGGAVLLAVVALDVDLVVEANPLASGRAGFATASDLARLPPLACTPGPGPLASARARDRACRSRRAR